MKNDEVLKDTRTIPIEVVVEEETGVEDDLMVVDNKVPDKVVRLEEKDRRRSEG